MTNYSAFAYQKIFFFLLFGGLTFIIYYALLWSCYNIVGLPYLGAVTISYSMAIIFHFQANKNITFNADKTKFQQQISRYLTVTIFHYAIQLKIIQYCYETHGINIYLSAFFGIVLTTITGYFLMNFWVFKKAKA